MDSSDDVAYLNYLSDKSHNFLLQSGDDGLCVQDPAFNSEPIFGDLDDGNHTWTIGGLPVLLNAPIISDDTPVESPMGLESQKMLPDLEQNEDSLVSNIESAEASLTYPIEIPGSGFLTSNGLFLSNDVLLQLSLQNVDQPASDVYSSSLQEKVANSENSNDNVYEVDYECESSFAAECKAHTEISENTNISIEGNQIVNVGNITGNSNDIIQLLNVDGTVINVNKDILNQNISTAMVNTTSTVEKNTDVDELIETIVAYKCKKCSSIFETTATITKHIRDEHCSQKESDLLRTESNSINNGSVIAMKSILNTTQTNKTQNQLVYLCSECDFGYSSTLELRNHMINEHKLTNGFKSTQDETSKNSDSDKTQEISVKQKYVSIVKKQQKASKKVKCSIKGCESRFISDEFRITHEKCHVNGQKKQFKCPNCEKTFSMWRVCSLHLWRCHNIDIGLLTCTVCNSYKTSSPHNLIIHMSIHDDIKQYLCNECGKGFKQLTQLRNHQVLHLGHDQGIPPWLTQQKCDLCGNFYADSKTLKKHIQGVHDKFKPYVCNICGHKCARKAMLELHLRQHTGEKPYKCSLCSYSTGDHNSLRRHRMRHNGDTKYSCPHCDYQSIQTVAYKKHIATKHPGKNGFFCCLYCSFQTVNENIYTTHFKTHQKNLSKTNQSTKSSDKNVSSAEETVSSDGTQVKKELAAMEVDDEETQHGFLPSLHTDETVDTGGITIPAGLEVCHLRN